MYSGKMRDACGDRIEVDRTGASVQVLFYGVGDSVVVDMELDAAGVKKFRKMLKRAITDATGGA